LKGKIKRKGDNVFVSWESRGLMEVGSMGAGRWAGREEGKRGRGLSVSSTFCLRGISFHL
jgi:hypothetical protein